jgi:uncharacterized cofD-like protein
MASLGPEPQALMEEVILERSGPRVVAIGGGKGLAQVLQAACRYAGTISAVVTVADDGGSSGRLAPALEIPPPGDIRKCLIALTPRDSVWRRLFEYRFEESDVGGHSLGNLIIASLADLEGDFEAALRAAERLLGSTGSVIPASSQRLRLESTIDGEIVHGQVNLSLHRGTVEEVRLIPPEATASDHALAAIAEAEQILLGPGSLYTSLIATLLVPGLVDAINESGARLVLVANLTTQDGETLGMDCADHVETLIRMTGVRFPSAIVANRSTVEVSPPVEALRVDADVMATYGVDVVFADLVESSSGPARHDPARLGGVLSRLISN